MAWWSGLALLVAFVFAGLAQVTDRPAPSQAAGRARHPRGDRLTANVRYELDSAA